LAVGNTKERVPRRVPEVVVWKSPGLLVDGCEYHKFFPSKVTPTGKYTGFFVKAETSK
jgi:hypothetical protein